MSVNSDDEFSSNLLSTLLINGDDELPNPNPSSSPQPEEHQHHLQSTNSSLLIRQLPSQGLSFQLWPAASTLVSLLDLSPQTLALTPASSSSVPAPASSPSAPPSPSAPTSPSPTSLTSSPTSSSTPAPTLPPSPPPAVLSLSDN